MKIILRDYKTLFSYGFFIWLVPFLISFLIYPFRATNRPLFESLIAVIVAGATAYFASKFFRKHTGLVLEQTVFVGLVWAVMNIIFDSFFFIIGPIKMSPAEYFADIGLTYLMIPFITAGYASFHKDQS